MIQVCWRKCEKDDTDDADDQLILEIYDLLVKENWEWTERLGLFSRECSVKSPASRLMLDINYCQSLKWQGKTDKLQEELSKYDISTMSPKFALGVCALRSDRDGFYQNIGSAITIDGMKRTDFMEWPLFRELREDSDYGERIDSAFKSVSNQHNECS